MVHLVSDGIGTGSNLTPFAKQNDLEPGDMHRYGYVGEVV